MNNNIKRFFVLTMALAVSLALCARPGPGGGPRGGFRGGPPPMHHGGHHHHHHHHRGTGFAVGAGILGAGLVASAIYDATHPRPVIVESAPVVVTPAGRDSRRPARGRHPGPRRHDRPLRDSGPERVGGGTLHRPGHPAGHDRPRVAARTLRAAVHAGVGLALTAARFPTRKQAARRRFGVPSVFLPGRGHALHHHFSMNSARSSSRT